MNTPLTQLQRLAILYPPPPEWFEEDWPYCFDEPEQEIPITKAERRERQNAAKRRA